MRTARPTHLDAGRRAVLAGVSRAHVLTALQDAGEPLSVRELADSVGLHTNTVRWHLDQLVEAGWATRASADSGRPGRPRMLYAARPGADTGGSDSGYRLLADILAGYLAGTAPDPGGAAGLAGRAWGHYLVDKPAPFAQLSPDEVTAQVTTLLADLGFAPAPDPVGSAITLHACPFRDVAESHREVVCGVHLGLMQGALAELGSADATVRLDPFVTSCSCRAEIDYPATPDRARSDRARRPDPARAPGTSHGPTGPHPGTGPTAGHSGRNCA